MDKNSKQSLFWDINIFMSCVCCGKASVRRLFANFEWGQVFNIQISWLYPPNRVLGGRKKKIYNFFKKIIKIWNRKSRKYFFSAIFYIKTKVLIIFLEKNSSQLSFEVYEVYVAQKTKISRFVIELFFHLDPGYFNHLPRRLILTSATSRGYQMLAEDIRFFICTV